MIGSIPVDAEESPKPKISASSRGVENAISFTLRIPSTSSIKTSRPIFLVSFSRFSICDKSVSTKWRSDAHRAFGSMLVRSEEHTSELQSLMRISYAVYVLQKKKPTTDNK